MDNSKKATYWGIVSVFLGGISIGMSVTLIVCKLAGPC